MVRKLAWQTPEKATKAREDVELSSVANPNSPQLSKERRRVVIVE